MEVVLEDIDIASKLQCKHCGDTCVSDRWKRGSDIFCCNGCKTVFEIINDNELDFFYQLNSHAGISRNGIALTNYEYLDDPILVDKLASYVKDSNITVWLHLPSIHCSSCLWLLENISKLNIGINYSRVNFLEKRLLIQFDSDVISLRELVELLSQIGYAPQITLNDVDFDNNKLKDRSIYYKLGIAGFAFGNIMLLSFPEYLGLGNVDGLISQVISYLNILLILPVVFYCAKAYLKSAWRGVLHKHLNIDVPISLGILALFFKSLFDIFLGVGSGYLDSLAGLIFFLLIGKWFQNLTYDRIKFDLDYKSYFPIAASLVENKVEKKIGLEDIKNGNIIRIRHGELIPADGVLLSSKANIDYSFVTGESMPTSISQNNKVHSGGKVNGSFIEIEVQKTVASSYLTQLWNDASFKNVNSKGSISKINEIVSKYFTGTIVLISLIAFGFHSFYDISKAINVLATVLIIACPCAVALSMPFAFGNLIRLFGQRKIYFKNTHVIENCSKVNCLVFDKTGTITETSEKSLEYFGKELNEFEKRMIASLANCSTHALSKMIVCYFNQSNFNSVENFIEESGLGIKGTINEFEIKIGSNRFIDVKESKIFKAQIHLPEASNVFIEINGELVGAFVLKSNFRKKLHRVLKEFYKDYEINLISGDNSNDREDLLGVFKNWKSLHFQKSPFQKLSYIKELQSQKYNIAMIGDGLNDAGALNQSNVGVSITHNTSSFAPACDIIIASDKFEKLPLIFSICKDAVKLIYISYSIALLYNAIGVYFAAQGLLSPVIAAVLMPLSSITVVLFGFLSTTFLFKSKFNSGGI